MYRQVSGADCEQDVGYVVKRVEQDEPGGGVCPGRYVTGTPTASRVRSETQMGLRTREWCVERGSYLRFDLIE
jgi:hypothetical protein